MHFSVSATQFILFMKQGFCDSSCVLNGSQLPNSNEKPCKGKKDCPALRWKKSHHWTHDNVYLVRSDLMLDIPKFSRSLSLGSQQVIIFQGAIQSKVFIFISVQILFPLDCIIEPHKSEFDCKPSALALSIIVCFLNFMGTHSLIFLTYFR